MDRMNASAGVVAWLHEEWGEVPEVAAMVGGASARRFWRVLGDGPQGGDSERPGGAWIVMEWPSEVGAAEHGGATGGHGRWCEVAAFLEGRGVSVPKRGPVSGDGRFLLVEDLGGRHLFDAVQGAGAAQRMDHYRQAIDLLLRWEAAWHGEGGRPELPVFSEALFDREWDEFVTMGIEKHRERALNHAEREVLRRSQARLKKEIFVRPMGFSHRDFQSKNLLYRSARRAGDARGQGSAPAPEGGGYVVIDFQDAWSAPETYDLVALLRDSYVVLGEGELRALLAYYHGKRGGDAALLMQTFDLVTVQRKLKDAGRFVTLKSRGKPEFMPYYLPSLGYVKQALERLGTFEELATLLDEHVRELR